MGEKHLVQLLEQAGVLKNPILIAAFEAVDRAYFVRSEDRLMAYLDQPLSIGYGQTISQPSTVAFMLELLDPKPGQKILDIGTGSGYQAALLSWVVSHDEFNKELAKNKQGKVFGLEFLPELAQMARKSLGHHGFIKEGITEVHCLNATKGYEAGEPYDAIISAASGEFIPEAWKKQLKVGGRIVAPIDHSIILLIKKEENEFETFRFEGFSFVPFIPDVEPDE